MMNPSVQSDDKRFLELLERWSRGEFTRTDERELYALTQADDFRREAWEGFSTLPEADHHRHLVSLRNRLLKPSTDRRIPIFTWAAAAAALVLLSVAIYFVPKWTDQTPSPIAQTSAPDLPVPAAETPASPTTGDFDAETNAVLRETTRGKAKPTPQPKPIEPATAKDDNIAYDELLFAAEESEQKPAPAAPPLARPDSILVKPVEAVPVIAGGPAAQKQIATTYPELGGNDAISNIPVRTEPAKSRATTDVPAQRVAEAAKADQVQAEKKRSKAAAPPTQAAPAGGWDNFQLFLRQNARLTEDARNHNVSGKVRLKFIVGVDGKPANIEVLNSLGYGCDEEAKRLISLFQWLPIGTEPVTVVEVPFVR